MGLKDRFRRGLKVGLIRRGIKGLLMYKWYNISKGDTKVLLSDVKYFPEELCDFIIEVKPDSVDMLVENVNDWIFLENKMTGFPRKKYKIGTSENIFRIIKSQRDYYNLMRKIK